MGSSSLNVAIATICTAQSERHMLEDSVRDHALSLAWKRLHNCSV